MTTESQRQETAARLRQAVASEAYDGAQTALADYRRHVDEAAAAWPPDGPPPADLAREADELLQWALQVLRAARAQTSHELDQVTAVLRYLEGPRRPPAWKIDG